jgi:P-type Cu2+ transporter
MATAAANRIPLPACAHCGLPVPTPETEDSEAVYCCRACRMVALIIGKQQGEQNWNLLRLGFGTLLAMNIMMISLLLYSGGLEAGTIPIFRLVLLGLATPALAILLPPFLAGALHECQAKKISIDALIACGSLTAFSVSAVNTLRGSGAIYFDTATMLPVLVTFGKIIESCAKTRAADLLHSLETLLPATALRVSSEGSSEVGIGTLQSGDLIRIRPGERVAVDGRICEGTSCIEEAAFTGEFLPRTCKPGDPVFAGTVNGSGSLLVQAEKTGPEILLHGIVSLIDAAWRNPSEAERLAQRAATLFIPALLVIATGSVVCWSLLGNLGQGLLSALSVLVVACPCTVGIATPLATSLAIARAARAGIIVRGGSVMERIASTDRIFFDKTGTMTVGQPVLQGIQVIDPALDQGELLGRLATLESASGHVLGKAITVEAARRHCGAGSVSNVQIYPGSGISGAVTWQGSTKLLLAGTEAFVATGRGDSITVGDLVTKRISEAKGTSKTTVSQAPDGNHTAINVAWEGELRGRLLFGDTERPDARRCIEALGDYGISSVLLSGDRFPAALAVANRTGIMQVEAPRTPAQKLQAIGDSIAAGRNVAMVGDGINDAPALAAAHTGIAFGAGTDLARQAGNIVILSGRLMQVPWLIALSRRTGNIIRGNFAWSFGYNFIAVAAAAAGLLHPLLAALAMVVSSLTVLGNSLRITGFPDESDTLTNQRPARRSPKDGKTPSSSTLVK